MEDDHPDIEDDIFEKHINEIDERETPRWEMSEEEPDEERSTLMNHVTVPKKVKQLPIAVERPEFNSSVVSRSTTGGAGKQGSSILPGTDAKKFPLPVHKNGINIPPNMIVENGHENGHGWDDDFERDSVKDFCVPFREQEAKYMERTTEAICNRAAVEHIRQPNPYDDDQDSVKNFGVNSQRISRLPSDENLCLSPPWFEGDDGQIPDGDKAVLVETELQDTATSEGGDYEINDVITRAKMRADDGTRSQWQVEETLDFTKNFAAESSSENSRRPSSENISLTPPWMDTDRESSCKDVGEQELDSSNEGPSDSSHVQSSVPVISGVPSITHASSVGPPTMGGVPFTGNPQVPVSRSQRRIPPPRHNANLPKERELIPATVSVKPPQPRGYGDVYHIPAVTAHHRVNNPNLYMSSNHLGTRTQGPPVCFPPSIRSSTMVSGYRPHQDPYYGMTASPAQMVPNIMNMRQVAKRSPNVPADPSYSSGLRPRHPSDLIAHPGGTPWPVHGNGLRMSGPPRQAFRGDTPYYSQSVSWPYQTIPGQYPVHVQNNQPQPRIPVTLYDPRLGRTNFGSGAQRSMPTSDMRLYPHVADDNIVSDSDVSPVMSTRSDSQSSLAVYCYTPHRDGLETASVMSFASGASTHQDLDSKIEQVRNLIAVIDNEKELAQTLYSLSCSKDSCQAMRHSGCLPLLIKLQHRDKTKDPRVGREICMRSAQAMRNIISASTEDRRSRRELRVLKLLEMVRSYCVEVRYMKKRSSKERALEQALAAIMKLSFEEEHRSALGELGGVEALGEFLQLIPVSNSENEDLSVSPETSLSKYASMTLTNMTFGNTRNKKILGNSPGTVKAFMGHLTVLNDEDLIQVSASVLRNLSCKPDETSKNVFQECGLAPALITAAQEVSSESALRTILFVVWNLSAHSSRNKSQLCETPGALAFLVDKLAYKSMSNSISVVESSGGILRNLSSHVAVKSEYRTILREHDCFKILLSHLRSPSLRVVANACGILWNLSARCQDDQELLWKLGAVPLLKSLVTSKNKSIAKGAGAAIKNLQNYRASNPVASSQTRDPSSESRKQNAAGLGGGSPSQIRNRENHLGGVSSRSRDMQSLNSFTGSADDVAKDNGRKSSKLKDKSHSALQHGEADSVSGGAKGVRWVDDRTPEKRSGKESLRKTSTNEKKRTEDSSDEQQSLLTYGNEIGLPVSREAGKRDDLPELQTAVAQMNIGEKYRASKKSDRSHSPKVKKKSNSKNKKHVPDTEGHEVDNALASQNSQNGRSTNTSTSTPKHSSTNVRRIVYSEAQRSNSVENGSGKGPAKQSSMKTKDVSEGRGEHGGRGGVHEEDTEVPRSETSDDDNLKCSVLANKNNVKNVRLKSSDDKSDEKVTGLSKKTMELTPLKCQCPEETGIWVKRNKRCERCQRRRVSHSSESTSGSRRSSYESLPSSSRQVSRNESGTNGTGYVTTL